jgi:hypothetical protein
MSPAPLASACAAADVEAWLAELGLQPLERADRDGVSSWDLLLDGRRRAGLRVTVILDPVLALICWAHYAPPINDGFRRSYRKLLRWNDELPFVKFSIGEDERPLLVAEIPSASATRDALGLALARQVAVADRFFDESIEWLKAGGWSIEPVAAPAEAAAPGPGPSLLARYATALAELLGGVPADATGPATADATVPATADATVPATADATVPATADAAP